MSAPASARPNGRASPPRTAKPSAETTDTEAASPSWPSSRFTALTSTITSPAVAIAHERIARDRDRGRDTEPTLGDEPHRGRNRTQVVDDPEREGERQRHEQLEPVDCDQPDEEAGEHRDATEVRDRSSVGLERAREVDDPGPSGNRRGEGRHDQRDRQRYEELHTSTSDDVSLVHLDLRATHEAAPLVEAQRGDVVGAGDDLDSRSRRER